MSVGIDIAHHARSVAEWLLANHAGQVCDPENGQLISDIADVLIEFRKVPSKVRLTDQQKVVLLCLETAERFDRPCPSYEELGQALGTSSKSVVSRIVHQMADLGVVTFKPGRRRSIEIVGA